MGYDLVFAERFHVVAVGQAYCPPTNLVSCSFDGYSEFCAFLRTKDCLKIYHPRGHGRSPAEGDFERFSLFHGDVQRIGLPLRRQ